MNALFTLLNAIVAVPKIGQQIQGIIALVVLWYVQKSEKETLTKIADAAAYAARATNQEERLAAAQKWKEALSRDRISA